MRRNTTMAALAVAGLAGGASAALLGISVGQPTIGFNSGGSTGYDAVTSDFSVDAAPLAILFADGVALVTNGGVDIAIRVANDGALLGGAPGEDLVITGDVQVPNGGPFLSGTLLTGEVNEFGAADSGGTVDFYDFRFTVTGGLLADDYFSGKDIGVVLTSEFSSFNGDFSLSFGGEAKGNVGPIDLRGDVQGCTPGYWKQDHHFDSWPLLFQPEDLFEDVFVRDVPGDPTLAEALRLKGGQLNALMRHAAAALLNAASPDINAEAAFATPGDVVEAFQAAFDTEVYNPTKDAMDAANNNGCPLN